MPRKIFILLAAVVVMAAASAVYADLCPNCRDKMLIDSVGKCEVCGAPTASGALRLCPKCSARLGRCELCGGSLDGWHSLDATPPSQPNPPADKPATPRPEDKPAGEASGTNIPPEKSPQVGPAPVTPPALSPPALSPPAAPLQPIDFRRPGTYTSGKWQYRLDIAAPGTRNEGRWGWLLYDGQKLPRGQVNDYYRTPWGPIYWVDVPKASWGMHGWMPVPLGQNNRQGQPLALPARPAAAPPAVASPAPTAGGQSLTVTKADNGKHARLYVGNVIAVSLSGNPATGYQWQAVPTASPALRLAKPPEVINPGKRPGMVVDSVAYVFTFQAVQPGRGTIQIVYSSAYARPWEKQRPPADAFKLSFEVLPNVPIPPGRTAVSPSATAGAGPAPLDPGGTGRRY
jgi:predicted secreted protein